MMICILVSSLLENDAIGNDVCHQCLVLNRGDRPTVVHAEEVAHPAMDPYLVDREKVFDLINDPENLLIYHLGGWWQVGLEILKKARCPIAVKFHNITPPEFYEPYNTNAEAFCRQGLEQAKAIAVLPGVFKFLCASPFNARDLLGFNADKDKIAVSPPFHRLDDFKAARVDQGLARTLGDGKINVLFVGRIVPNKGHRHLIRVIAAYVAMYNSNIRLILVGSGGPGMGAYVDELNRLILQNGLNSIVEKRGHVSFDELHTYYCHSHVFLLMSEHEGFCLPILEAQFHGLPIVALAGTAVPDTLGQDQVLFDAPDYTAFAAAIHVIAENGKFRAHLGKKGEQNIGRFANRTLEPAFLKSLGFES
jgi:glycosyltransferase involved in cell wall biosynthesis